VAAAAAATVALALSHPDVLGVAAAAGLLLVLRRSPAGWARVRGRHSRRLWRCRRQHERQARASLMTTRR
jgi:hypothetical protein